MSETAKAIAQGIVWRIHTGNLDTMHAAEEAIAEEVDAALDAAVLEERERCATLCLEDARRYKADCWDEAANALIDIAIAIRHQPSPEARGKEGA